MQILSNICACIRLIVGVRRRSDWSVVTAESGVYRITHDPQHADMPHEVAVIQGRRFPTCRHCKGISFELVHAAKHVGEIDHLHDAEQGAAAAG